MNEKEYQTLYLEGAKNLISSLELNTGDSLIILSNEGSKDFSNYILKGAKQEKIDNIIHIVLPDIYRPVTKIPTSLAGAIEKTKGLIYIVNRLPEENFTFNRPLQELCVRNKCKYVYIYDSKIQYLKEGIAADYADVYKKAKKIKKILENSKEINITSEIGTNLTFGLYSHNVIPRSPVFPKNFYWNQAPEGEVMTCPIENTFNGTLVVDGPVTGMGQPERLITWIFKNGVVTKVEGDNKFLSSLLSNLQASDKRLKSLIGIWIAEFSVGVNDWAVFDDNISNCEKVSGGIHFAMGNSEGLGIDRGETFHFDNIVKTPTIVVTDKNGEKLTLAKSGKAMI